MTHVALWNVAGPFVTLTGITKNIYSSSCEVKDLLSRPCSPISIWQYHELPSGIDETWASLNLLMHLSIQERRYKSKLATELELQ